VVDYATMESALCEPRLADPCFTYSGRTPDDQNNCGEIILALRLRAYFAKVPRRSLMPAASARCISSASTP